MRCGVPVHSAGHARPLHIPTSYHVKERRNGKLVGPVEGGERVGDSERRVKGEWGRDEVGLCDVGSIFYRVKLMRYTHSNTLKIITTT